MSPEARALVELVGTPEATIPQVWSERVKSTPDARFLVCDGNEWTYAQAWKEILAAAATLSRAGVKPGDTVASYLSNRPETLWCWFGALIAGAVYAPLNRSHKGELLAAMIARSGAHLLVTEEGSGLSPSDAPALLNIDETPFVGHFDGEIGGETTPFDDALVIYTSGTTGGSKAARLSHQYYCHLAGRVVDAWQMTSGDVYHAWLPHFHVAGTLHQTMAMIVAGGSVALFEKYSASRFMDQIRAVGATIVIGLPNVVNILWQSAPGPQDVSGLRLMISTAINPDYHRAFERRFGLKLVEQYGMTEAELITLPGINDVIPPRSCGRVSEDWDVIIADTLDRPLATGQTGQILVRPRRPGILMTGYMGQDAATADAFRNLWFHTGDFGYLDPEGYLYFADREKHIIRRRSENISSVELERIVEKHPAVSEAAAVGVPSPLGEQDVKLCVTCKPGQLLDLADLHEFCRDAMAAFMVPRYIELLAEFPRTDVGKIDKTRLAKITEATLDFEKGRPNA